MSESHINAFVCVILSEFAIEYTIILSDFQPKPVVVLSVSSDAGYFPNTNGVENTGYTVGCGLQ
jgi:hypothetical protein